MRVTYRDISPAGSSMFFLVLCPAFKVLFLPSLRPLGRKPLAGHGLVKE